MISIDNILYSDLTLILDVDEEKYIQVNGSNATCLIGVKIEASGTYTIKSTNDAISFLQLTDTEHNDINWGAIKYNTETPVNDFTADIVSLKFDSPNILYIKNTSPGSQKIRFSLRGNK